MTVNAMYLPTVGQANAAARASAVGATVTSSTIPPVYQAAVTNGGGAPGVIAEYSGTVVYAHDDGTLTAGAVTTLIAPLLAAQTAAQQTQANQATILANISSRQATIQAWISANPSGAVLTAGQTLTLAEMLNGLCDLLLQQYGSTSGT